MFLYNCRTGNITTVADFPRGNCKLVEPYFDSSCPCLLAGCGGFCSWIFKLCTRYPGCKPGVSSSSQMLSRHAKHKIGVSITVIFPCSWTLISYMLILSESPDQPQQTDCQPIWSNINQYKPISTTYEAIWTNTMQRLSDCLSTPLYHHPLAGLVAAGTGTGAPKRVFCSKVQPSKRIPEWMPATWKPLLMMG